MSRLFLAVWPPRPVVEQLRCLPRPDEVGVRWVRPDDWHLTLRFLGRADPDDVRAALTGFEFGATEVALGPAVGRLGRSAVSLPATGLDELATEIVERTADVGVAPDPRPFTGHLTLARVKRGATCGLVGTPFEASFVASQVVLAESVSHDGGVHYRALRRW